MIFRKLTYIFILSCWLSGIQKGFCQNVFRTSHTYSKPYNHETPQKKHNHKKRFY